MKKYFLFIALTVSGLHAIAQDQSESSPSFELPRAVIKISPLLFFTSTFEMGVEVFNASLSRSFNISLGLRTSAESSFDKGSGYHAEVAYRKYVAPMKIHTRKHREFYQGIYYSLFLKGEYFKGEDPYYYYYNSSSYPTDYEEKILSISPGFTIGLQKTLWEIILMDIYVGGGVKFSSIDGSPSFGNNYYNEYSIIEPGYDGIYPKIGIKFGVGL